MTKINELLLKIKALADGTNFEGERDAAQKHLRRLMETHGITEADLSDLAITRHEFSFSRKREENLLHQIFYKIMGMHDYAAYCYKKGGKKIPGKVSLDCTKGQKLEIDFLFDFYRTLYHREEEAFFSAFVQKHKLFGKPANGEGTVIAKEEALKLAQMQSGMDNLTPFRQIAEKGGAQ